MVGSSKAVTKSGSPAGSDAALQSTAESTVAVYREKMDQLDFSVALEALWSFVTRANRYVEETKPWSLAKDAARGKELDAVLYNLAESVRLISVMIQPVMLGSRACSANVRA